MVQSHFLHRAGGIQLMLLMVWGGESLTQSQWQDMFTAVNKSHAKTRELGVRHGEVRRPNTLWNSEPNRVLILDSHKSKLTKGKIGMLKRKSELQDSPTKRSHFTVYRPHEIRNTNLALITRLRKIWCLHIV
jgi:hypothetical protein